PPMKSILRCNWKIPTENFIGDGYHIPWTHVSSLMAIGGEIGQIFQDQETLMNLGHQITTRHGHGFASASGAGPLLYKDPARYMAYYESQRPGVIEKLGPIRGERFYGAHWNASIFPNCSFLYGTNTFKVWHPRGPHEIEVWTWSMVEDAMPEDLKKEVIHQAILTFGTAGMFESDDGENMEACTHSNRGWQTRKGRMVSNMALRHEDRNEGLPGITAQGAVGETAQRGFYRFWAEMMNAENWAAIHRNDKTWDEVLRRTAA
ncbi:MAG: RHO alpha subunit C-terminal catalytic domain-containing protein, partial [Pseudomonadota bacterium]|nr:RHO alpha subunit C-terminal catalytic domain-containing protein [Pseudomonadota bacterium]